MEPSELTPAEFDGVRRNRYRPRIPWARVGFVVLVAALFAGAYFWRQKVRADELRERIRAEHAEHVAPVLDELEATRIELEIKALDAKSGAANRLVEAEVPLSALHDTEMVYLQVRASELASEEGLRGRRIRGGGRHRRLSRPRADTVVGLVRRAGGVDRQVGRPHR